MWCDVHNCGFAGTILIGGGRALWKTYGTALALLVRQVMRGSADVRGDIRLGQWQEYQDTGQGGDSECTR
jgi:hypothetical protein